MKKYTRTRRQIERLIKKWRPICGLEQWSIEFVFLEKEGEHENSAWCEAWPQYEDARITFYLPRMVEHYPTLLAMEEVVVHEMVHAIAWRCNEREVTRVGKAILRAYDAGTHSRTAKKRLFK